MGGSRRIVAVVITAALALLMVRGLFGCRREQPTASSFTSAARNVAPPREVLGAGSCSSSGCHAAAVEGHAAWESAYTVWAARDRHTQAYKVLHEPLARQIVAALAVRDPARPHPPAHENKACLGCHATERRAAMADGVSCESCHGPAGDWLVAHTLPGWKTKGNTLGMVDLADPFACASQCGQCHIGGAPAADGALHEVSHDLIAAGHPRLTFELRSFKAAEPPHWRDRFTASAGDAGPLDEWALGRLGGLEVYLAQVAAQSTAAEQDSAEARRDGAAGVWPEFTAFDCYGCHRPAVAPLDRATTAGVPPVGRRLGVPRLEPMTWSLLSVILPEEADQTLGAFREGVEANWWRPPSSASIEACRQAIEHARPGVTGRLAALPAADLARTVLARVDATNWDEAVSATQALTALVDQAALARDVSTSRERLAALRRLLEFQEADVGGRRVRFDSPQGYDAARVQAELKALATSLEQ